MGREFSYRYHHQSKSSEKEEEEEEDVKFPCRPPVPKPDVDLVNKTMQTLPPAFTSTALRELLVKIGSKIDEDSDEEQAVCALYCLCCILSQLPDEEDEGPKVSTEMKQVPYYSATISTNNHKAFFSWDLETESAVQGESGGFRNRLSSSVFPDDEQTFSRSELLQRIVNVCSSHLLTPPTIRSIYVLSALWLEFLSPTEQVTIRYS